MSEPGESQITELLIRWTEGDRDVGSELMERVYQELKVLARHYLQRESPNHTLETSGLIHEAYFRLIGQDRLHWANRKHFYGIASQSMRRILIDHARQRAAKKRGGGIRPLALDEALGVGDQKPADLLAIDDALEALAKTSPEKARLVELRFFGGLTHGEIAVMEGVAIATIDRRWRVARALLFEELR